MPLFRTIKKFLNFSPLVIFIFFISCVVNAHNPSERGITQDVASKKNSKKSASKNVVAKKSLKKVSKKTASKSVKKSSKKKIHKVIRKKIITKIYVDKTERGLAPKLKQRAEGDFLENYKKQELGNYQQIGNDYLIEVELNEDNCDRITGQECFRSDRFFQEPYFHYTILTIFNRKVMVEQFFEDNAKDKFFLKAQDGEYLLYTKNDNKILLGVRNGLVDELMVLEGDLDKESKITNKCQYGDKLYAYHHLHKTNEIEESKIFYSDKKNFKGLLEGVVFVEKYQPKVFYSLFKSPNKEFRASQNVNLCKIGDNIEAIERDYTKSECNRKFRCTMKTLESYGSEGFFVRDQNFSFFDYHENNMLVSLSREQISGLLDEVGKLSAEDKKYLRSRCFNDKNVDLMSCSASEKCDDYLVIDSCEVSYFYDSDKIGLFK